MNTDKGSVHLKSKIWIEDDNGKVIFGLGRFKILSAIEKYGSINAASKQLKMGYRAIWGKIKTTEEALGKPLLSRNTGGSKGGGSQLTPVAKSLLKEFRKVHNHVINKSDDFFEGQFKKLFNENNEK
ncbi:MAG: LysR family transcriptional regulator [Desulfobacteraceae bacterium]|nr:LysR family transcriptional regulator [Desulfobacteraceae bacterium]